MDNFSESDIDVISNYSSDSSLSEKLLDDLIEEFHIKEYDNILTFYYELKDRFIYFLDLLTYNNLLELIIDLKFNDKIVININSYENYNIFLKEYNTEINVTNDIINNYIKKYNINIQMNEWENYCFKYTSKIKKVCTAYDVCYTC